MTDDLVARLRAVDHMSVEDWGIRKRGLESALLPVDAQSSTFVKACWS